MTISPEAMEWLRGHSGGYASEILTGIEQIADVAYRSSVFDDSNEIADSMMSLASNCERDEQYYLREGAQQIYGLYELIKAIVIVTPGSGANFELPPSILEIACDHLLEHGSVSHLDVGCNPTDLECMMYAIQNGYAPSGSQKLINH